MATYNLQDKPISSSFDELIQIDENNFLRDGTGSLRLELKTTGSISASTYYGDGSNLTGISASAALPSGVVSGSSQITLTDTTGNLGGNRITGSVGNAVSSSYADTAPFDGILNKPTLVSGSSQIDFTGLSNIPSGLVSSSTQVSFNGITDVPSGLVSGSSQIDLGLAFGTASQAVSASHAEVADLANDATYAQNTITTGKNLSGGEILKGTPLYFTGSGTSGNIVGVYPADAGNPSRMPAGGIAGETIADGAEGVVLLDGYIGGVNTTGFDSGDKVYVGVGGGYTKTQPTGSAFIQFLGNIEKGNSTNGSGVIQMHGEERGLPNLTSGYAWVGDGNGVPQAVATSSFAVSVDTGSLVTTSSFNAYTSSNDSKVNSLINSTGSLVLTASFDNGTRDLTFTKVDTTTFAVNIPSVSGSVAWNDVTNKPQGLVSGSSQIDYAGLTNIPSGIVSGSDQVTSSLDGRYAVLNGGNTFNGDQVVTGSITSTDTIFDNWDLSAAGLTSVNNLNNVTGRNGETFATTINGFAKVGNPELDGVLTLFTQPGQYFSSLSVGPNAMRYGLQPSGSATESTIKLVDNGDTSTTATITADTISISGDTTLSGSIDIQNTLTASLQEGYVWAGGSGDRSILVATSSFAGGGGGGIFEQTGSFYATTNDLQVTGSFVVDKAIAGSSNTLSITSQTASIDLELGNTFELTLVSGSDTHLDVSNFWNYSSVNILVKQPSVGTGSISFSPDFKFGQGYAYLPTPAVDAEDILSFTRFGSHLYGTYINNFG